MGNYKRVQNNITEVIDSNNEKIIERKDISNRIVEYFSSVGKQIRSGKEIVLSKYHEKQQLSENNLNDLEAEITLDEIEKIIKSGKIRKAEGPDKICPFMIKKGSKLLRKTLKKLFNTIWIKKLYPNLWSKGQIIPIPKV